MPNESRFGRREVLRALPLVAGLPEALPRARRPARARQVSERRPNVLVFISDQQRADTLPGTRRFPIRTPHLDWLAERATLFERAYCTTPMCSPSRASLLSGLFPHTTGMVSNHQARPISSEIHLDPSVKLLADYLRPVGYACGYAGKWHLGTGSDRRGFRDFVTRAGDFDVDRPEDSDVLRFAGRLGVRLGGKRVGDDPDPTGYDPRTQVGASLLPLAFHPSMQDAVAAAGFIRRQAAAGRPFALVYSCREPHPPFVSPRPFPGTHAPAQMRLPETRRDPAAERLLRARPDWQVESAAAFGDDDLRLMWAGYCGAISFVDHLLGTLLAALIETGRLDDTLVVFTSDHGELLGSHGMLFKGALLFEELVRVPLLVKPPRRTSPHRTAQLVSHVDLVPSILAWCGVAPPAALQGRDLRGLTEGGDTPVREGLALEYHSANWGERPAPLRGWVTREAKYVEGPDGPEELYDLRADPNEADNRVGDPASAGTRLRLRTALASWLGESGDRWPAIPRPAREIPRKPGIRQ